MNELLSLLPVLFLVYLFQCIASAPNTGEVFFLGRRMRGQRLRHALQVGRSQNNVFIFNPFLPYVGAAFVHPPPAQIHCRRIEGNSRRIALFLCSVGRRGEAAGCFSRKGWIRTVKETFRAPGKVLSQHVLYRDDRQTSGGIFSWNGDASHHVFLSFCLYVSSGSFTCLFSWTSSPVANFIDLHRGLLLAHPLAVSSFVPISLSVESRRISPSHDRDRTFPVRRNSRE